MSFEQRHAGLGVRPEHIEKLGDFSLLAQVESVGSNGPVDVMV